MEKQHTRMCPKRNVGGRDKQPNTLKTHYKISHKIKNPNQAVGSDFYYTYKKHHYILGMRETLPQAFKNQPDQYKIGRYGYTINRNGC